MPTCLIMFGGNIQRQISMVIFQTLILLEEYPSDCRYDTYAIYCSGTYTLIYYNMFIFIFNMRLSS
ncbi:hypothetical protein UP36_24390 [Salmonella enterica subsp. enterica]|nr:hypothetical protein [Salmonella enterica subsp. enterica]ECI2267598.1 hypothetical protein [Salmonella enterica subsp. enterica serovar Wandsworth]HAC6854040.1 hypothetical protein [Salmonella enterica subsp. enterica serovar Dublin]